jgi:hypothetical protein
MSNPFLKEQFGRIMGACSASDRLDAIKCFDVERLRQVVAMDGIQKSVRVAAERLIRKKLKEAECASQKSTAC